MKGFLSVLILPTFVLFTPNLTLATQSTIIKIDKLFSESQAVWEFTKPDRIYSLSISGSLELNGDNSLVRVILVRDDLHEYLVYEAYPLIVDSHTLKITDVCEETCFLGGIAPHSLKIELDNASLQINDISVTDYPPALRMEAAQFQEQIKVDRDAAKVKKLNENIKKKGLKWIAGETSVSKLSYEEKKKLFGGKVPNLQGAEYYKGGIFEIKSPDSSESAPVNSESLLEVRVSASSDDAEEQPTGRVLLVNDDLELVHVTGSGYDNTVGIRFTGLDIPQGASILNAYMQFKVDETTSVPTLLTIEGHDTDNALTFETIDWNVSSRTRTSASVIWSPVAWTTVGEAGPDQRTPNMRSVIQEIVDRPGWSSGNSLAFIITGSGSRVAAGYEGDPDGAPLLHVEHEISELIEAFDWRSRHGANNPDSPYYDGDPTGSGWLTPVKRQGCNDCWVFSPVHATEAIVNLYFNQHLDLDLSEQDVASCSGGNIGCCEGGYIKTALNYIINTGVVDEDCFPYSASCESCASTCSLPNEQISINGTKYPGYDEEDIKRAIFDYGPITGGISSWWHFMVMVGFDKDLDDGETIWIFKNSWGPSWGENGYGYLKVPLSDLYGKYALITPVTSLVTHYEIACYDMDGDGYYNWGISKKKPSSCPEDSFSEPDCDDSDPNLGPFDLDGHCIDLSMANFTANPTTGPAPLTVQFTDQSMGLIEVWDWDFGDGETSSVQNPSHTYHEPGIYTVVLTVTSAGGSHTKSKSDYINVCVPNTYYRDADGDSYGDPNDSTQACTQPNGYVTDNTDCDDNDPLEHPNQTWYKDADDDGYSDGTANTTSCTRLQNYKAASELTATSGDCDDSDPDQHPGASEVCNDEDDDCDEKIDEGVKITFYLDSDGDGYGNPNSTTQACSPPSGYVENNLDCDDTDILEHPGQTWYKDYDNDGYSNGTKNTTSCTRPAGYKVASELTAISGDCNDSDASINPGASEVCNGIDDNCDDQVDEGVKITYYLDSDGDGYGDPQNSTQACSQPTGYVEDNTDCDDSDPLEHPNQTWYRDADDDGYSGGVVNTTSCTRPEGYKVITELTAISGDCDDDDPNQNPEAEEVCNGEDDDCDSQVDEGCNPPDADAGVDQEVPEETKVKLDGSESDDPDGTIVSYLWEQIGGTPTVTLIDADKAVASFTAPNVTPTGTSLTFRLTVIDDKDFQSVDTCIVDVIGDNDPPTADAGRDQKAVEGAKVTLDGSRSSDPDDGIASYQWEQVGGTVVNLSGSEMAQCYFVAPDVEKDRPWLTFQLTVKDGEGSENTDVCKVHVMEPKAMPWIPLLLLDE